MEKKPSIKLNKLLFQCFSKHSLHACLYGFVAQLLPKAIHHNGKGKRGRFFRVANARDLAGNLVQGCPQPVFLKLIVKHLFFCLPEQ